MVCYDNCQFLPLLLTLFSVLCLQAVCGSHGYLHLQPSGSEGEGPDWCTFKFNNPIQMKQFEDEATNAGQFVNLYGWEVAIVPLVCMQII